MNFKYTFFFLEKLILKRDFQYHVIRYILQIRTFEGDFLVVFNDFIYFFELISLLPLY